MRLRTNLEQPSAMTTMTSQAERLSSASAEPIFCPAYSRATGNTWLLGRAWARASSACGISHCLETIIKVSLKVHSSLNTAMQRDKQRVFS